MEGDRLHPDPASGPATKWRRLESGRDTHVSEFDSSRPLVQIAPMLHVSDRHFRAFLRQLTSRAQLWTEMVVDQTIKHTDDLPRHLGFSPFEQPVVCQLGGSDPTTMAEAAKIVSEWGYKEINVNAGCPSSKVVDCGMFGALLMYDPPLIREICTQMKSAVPHVPVTVKSRIAVDDHDSFDWLTKLVDEVAKSGVDHFVMHARPAWIKKKKLSPAQNRSIPPLDFNRVFELAEHFPDLKFTINGGIQNLSEVEALLQRPHPERPQTSLLYGTMIGRAAADNPAFLADVDRRIYRDKSNPATAWSRQTVLEGYADYLNTHEARQQTNEARHAFPLVRPTVGLFHSTRGSKHFRQNLDKLVREHAKEWAPAEIVGKLIDIMKESHSHILEEPLTPEDSQSTSAE